MTRTREAREDAAITRNGAGPTIFMRIGLVAVRSGQRNSQAARRFTRAEGKPISRLTVTFSSGARPQEMRRVEARHYDPQFSRWAFRVKESKGKARQRAVYLDDTATEIVERLVATYPDGPLFGNSRGKPWTKGSITARFRRLKAKLNMPELCAYTLRHSYSHWKLTSGTEAHIVSKLLGHKEGRMLETRYGHADQNEAFMLQQARKRENPLGRKRRTSDSSRSVRPNVDRP